MVKSIYVSHQPVTYPPSVIKQTKISPRKLTAQLCIVQIYAVALATFVYLIIFLLLTILGRAVWSKDVAAIISLPIVLFVIWRIIPSFYGYPPNVVLAEEAQFPVLNDIVGQIAGLIGVPQPALLVTERFDAAFVRLGWRRGTVIEVGHPLLSLLTMQETLIVLAHEIAHSADRAATRSLYVRIAYSMLYRWEELFDPTKLTGWQRLFWPPMVLFWGVTRPILLQLRTCISIDHQAAEHWADSVAATIAGGDDSAELYFKLTLGYHTAFANAYNEATPEQKYPLVRQTIANLPDEVRQRVKQHMLTQPAPRFALHPCVSERLMRQQQSGMFPPMFQISAEKFAALHDELNAWPVIMAEREADYFAQLRTG
jgi:hypothetical protein